MSPRMRSRTLRVRHSHTVDATHVQDLILSPVAIRVCSPRSTAHANSGQGQLAAPTPGLGQQPEQPFEVEPLHPTRGAVLDARDEIERAAHAHHDRHAQRLPMPGDPEVLLRRAIGHEQDVRPGLPDCGR